MEQVGVNDDVPAVEHEAQTGEGTTGQTYRKAFVEPEVSFPIDVLEATTFFQLTDSGAVL